MPPINKTLTLPWGVANFEALFYIFPERISQRGVPRMDLATREVDRV
jgi:hypothetical protein